MFLFFIRASSKMLLSDAIVLALACVLLLVGLQAFFDPDRRKLAPEVLKATFMMVAGLYLLYFWYQGVSASSGKVGYYP
jgi:hypothetical protein